MLVASVFKDRHGHLEKRSIRVCVLQKFTACVAEKKLGVLLVGEAVGRDVIGLETGSSLQRRFPFLDGLAWQSEHEIDVDVGESGSSQNMERLLRLLRVVLQYEKI